MEVFFLHVQLNRNSTLVSCTLKGAKRQHGTPICRKTSLLIEDLQIVYNEVKLSSDHDDLLFLSQLLVGFNVLLCLGKLCFPDQVHLCDFSKISLHSVQWLHKAVSFWLPSQKANPTFEGSRLIIQKVCDSPDPHLAYLHRMTNFSCSILNSAFMAEIAQYLPTHGSSNT